MKNKKYVEMEHNESKGCYYTKSKLAKGTYYFAITPNDGKYFGYFSEFYWK